MKVAYDPEVDALYIRLVEGPREVTTHRPTENVLERDALTASVDDSVAWVQSHTLLGRCGIHRPCCPTSQSSMVAYLSHCPKPVPSSLAREQVMWLELPIARRAAERPSNPRLGVTARSDLNAALDASVRLRPKMLAVTPACATTRLAPRQFVYDTSDVTNDLIARARRSQV